MGNESRNLPPPKVIPPPNVYVRPAVHRMLTVDLLFYYRFLKALIVFDLKIGEFEPEHAGKM
jgi:predicted nuclease of restriction endonuclease-like (RecB) superfamily